jgi:hypothetical protein
MSQNFTSCSRLLHLVLTFWAAFCLILLSLVAFVQAQEEESCPNLDERLVGLVSSPDPEAYARSHGLYYEADMASERETIGWVRVVIELENATEAFPDEYGLRIESRYGTLIQAMVLSELLCAISNVAGVAYVRAVHEPYLDTSFKR